MNETDHQPTVCERCGSELTPDAERCAKCGHRPPEDPRSWAAFKRGQEGGPLMDREF
jgi:predicted amidophosphoribosyltransferase